MPGRWTTRPPGRSTPAASTPSSPTSRRRMSPTATVCAPVPGADGDGPALLVVAQPWPESAPAPVRVAQHDRHSLLAVVQPDVVVDVGEDPAPGEVRRRVGRPVVPQQQHEPVTLGWSAPGAEAVVAAVGAREAVARSHQVHRARLAVAEREEG